jgi:methionyl-tRNA formyltransferase
LRDAKTQEIFNNLAADVAVVAAYGLLLPISILTSPKFGCINLHPSLLPRWRGAAPIQRAVMAGDAQTGVDVTCMDPGLDTGPVAMRQIIPIRPDDTAGDLTSRLAAIAARLSINALRSLKGGPLEFHKQPTIGVCYAQKIKKSEAEIDWTRSAEIVRNQIHGLSPAPGAFSTVLIGDRRENMKFFRAEVATGTGPPGMLLSEDMQIACGIGTVRVLQGQRAGKAMMSGHELMRGAKLAAGALFTHSRAPSPVPHAGV